MRSIWSGIRLFFFSDLVREVQAHTSVEVARRARETRTAVSPFQSHAWSVAFLACFARRIKKKERLLVVQVELFPANFHSCLSLPNAFQVRVFVSLSHQDQSSDAVHSPSAVWAESISTAGFQLCSRATGSTNVTGIINWVAFQDKPMLAHGSVTFSGTWTTETKCEKMAFSQVRQQ